MLRNFVSLLGKKLNMPDYSEYMGASPRKQMEMLIQSIKEQQERLKPENYFTASPSDQLKILINSLEEEKRREAEGYYLHAPLFEQMAYMARKIQEQIAEETRLKIEEIEFFLPILEDNKMYIIAMLDKIDKKHPNVGNLKVVNDLLDKLIIKLKQILEKETELKNLKK